jgi:hypothetical protein
MRRREFIAGIGCLSTWPFTPQSANAIAKLFDGSGAISTTLRGPTPASEASPHLAQAAPDLLVVTRTRNDLKHFEAPPFVTTIADRATIEKLYEDILALPPLPAGRLDCPRNSGLRYRLDFYVGRALLLSGDYAPTGCRTVSLSDGTVKSDSRGSFGTDFVQALGFS